MQLPIEFKDKYTYLLQDEANAFFASYNDPKVSGLRLNPLKTTEEQFFSLHPFSLERVPFCNTGFYYSENDQPGKHPYHAAGVYYIQEPSAMIVGEVLSPEPGEVVLDLCAAPGGKSTHIAGMMQNTGLLISNEIHPTRVKALSENIERLGVRNCIVTNETPKHLASKLEGFFDKILVDAPCSGEGMFRKDENAITYWSQKHVEECAALQRDILHNAYQMLKNGGTMVYSTCTYSPEENEQTIEWFLEQYEDMELIPIEKNGGMEDGRVEWTMHHTDAIRHTARLWPHQLRGEGHFVAKLQKHGNSDISVKREKQTVTKQQMKDYKVFQDTALTKQITGTFVAFTTQLYVLPPQSPTLDHLKVVRAGLHLGECKKNRFEPNHSLALTLKQQDVNHTISLSSKSEEWKRYLRGETLQTGQNRGWCIVTIDGYTLGWGKEAQGILKNFYPKGLRQHV